MKKEKSTETGLLSLEACIVVTIFIFLMLFMYSFFVVFEARNEMAHVMLATADSMALDAYENTNLGDSDTLGEILFKIYGENVDEQNGFSDTRTWYDSATMLDESGSEILSDAFSDAIKSRFTAYLAGGDSTKAEEKLKRYHIQNGIEGLDFSNSKVSGGNLYLSVKYSIEYEFQVFGLDALEMEQKVCSKLWK